MTKRAPFRPIPSEFDPRFQDEQATTDAFEEYVGGVARAQRLLYIWNNSYPTGTLYDRDFRTGYYHSKTDNFRAKAKREGFDDEDVNAFLSLQ